MDVVQQCLTTGVTGYFVGQIPPDCLPGVWHRDKANHTCRVHVWSAGPCGHAIVSCAEWAARSGRSAAAAAKQRLHQTLRANGDTSALVAAAPVAAFERGGASERMALATGALVILEASADPDKAKRLATPLAAVTQLLECVHLQLPLAVAMTTAVLHAADAYLLGDIVTSMLRIKGCAGIVRMLAASVPGAMSQAVDALVPLSTGVGAQAAVARDCLQSLAALAPCCAHKARQSLLLHQKHPQMVVAFTLHLHDEAALLTAAVDPNDTRAASNWEFISTALSRPPDPAGMAVSAQFRQAMMTRALSAVAAEGLNPRTVPHVHAYLLLVGSDLCPTSQEARAWIAVLQRLRGRVHDDGFAWVAALLVVLLAHATVTARDCAAVLKAVCLRGRRDGRGDGLGGPPRDPRGAPASKRVKVEPAAAQPSQPGGSSSQPAPKPPPSAEARADLEFAAPGAALLALTCHKLHKSVYEWVVATVRHVRPIAHLDHGVPLFVSAVEAAGLTHPSLLATSLAALPPVQGLSAASANGGIGLKVLSLLLDSKGDRLRLGPEVAAWLQAQIDVSADPLNLDLLAVVQSAARAAGGLGDVRVPPLALEQLVRTVHERAEQVAAGSPASALAAIYILAHVAALRSAPPGTLAAKSFSGWVDALHEVPAAEMLLRIQRLHDPVDPTHAGGAAPLSRGFAEASEAAEASHPPPPPPSKQHKGYQALAKAWRRMAAEQLRDTQSWPQSTPPPLPPPPQPPSHPPPPLDAQQAPSAPSAPGPDPQAVDQVPAPVEDVTGRSDERPRHSAFRVGAPPPPCWQGGAAMLAELSRIWAAPALVCKLLHDSRTAAGARAGAAALESAAVLTALALSHYHTSVIDAWCAWWRAVPHRLHVRLLPLVAWRWTHPIGVVPEALGSAEGADALAAAGEDASERSPPLIDLERLAIVLEKLPTYDEVVCTPQTLLACHASVWASPALLEQLLDALIEVRSAMAATVVRLLCPPTKAPKRKSRGREWHHKGDASSDARKGAADHADQAKEQEAVARSVLHLQNCAVVYAIVAAADPLRTNRGDCGPLLDCAASHLPPPSLSSAAWPTSRPPLADAASNPSTAPPQRRPPIDPPHSSSFVERAAPAKLDENGAPEPTAWPWEAAPDHPCDPSWQSNRSVGTDSLADCTAIALKAEGLQGACDRHATRERLFAFLQMLFCEDAALLRTVLLQACLPEHMLPLLVRGVPALSSAAGVAEELLDSDSKRQQFFGARLAAHLARAGVHPAALASKTVARMTALLCTGSSPCVARALEPLTHSALAWPSLATQCVDTLGACLATLSKRRRLEGDEDERLEGAGGACDDVEALCQSVERALRMLADVV